MCGGGGVIVWPFVQLRFMAVVTESLSPVSVLRRRLIMFVLVLRFRKFPKGSV